MRTGLPSPFGRGAGGEGMGKSHKQGRAFSRPMALTLTLSRRERGPGIRNLQRSTRLTSCVWGRAQRAPPFSTDDGGRTTEGSASVRRPSPVLRRGCGGARSRSTHPTIPKASPGKMGPVPSRPNLVYNGRRGSPGFLPPRLEVRTMSENSISTPRPGPADITRRRFLAGATAAGLTIRAPDWRPAPRPTRRSRSGLIGCGGRGNWIANLFMQHGGYQFVGHGRLLPGPGRRRRRPA